MGDSSLRGISAALSRRHDQRAQEEFGVPSSVLMENAGRSAAELLHARIPADGRSGVCFCGPGNNGGDGLVVARHLLLSGWEIRVCLLPGRSGLSGTGDHAWNLATVRALGIPVDSFDDTRPVDGAVVVDAVFGTGLQRSLEGPARRIVERMASHAGPVLSLDVPSGLDADTGEVHGAAVRATWTVTFAAAKVGLLRPGARSYVGELFVRHIGVPFPLPELDSAR